MLLAPVIRWHLPLAIEAHTLCWILKSWQSTCIMLSSKFSVSASLLSTCIMITAIMHKKNLHKSLDLLTSKMRPLPILSLLKKHLLAKVTGGMREWALEHTWCEKYQTTTISICNVSSSRFRFQPLSRSHKQKTARGQAAKGHIPSNENRLELGMRLMAPAETSMPN